MVDDSDLQLMRRLARGEDQAMVGLVERWQRPVLAFTRRFLGCSVDEAQDVAQETFLRVWRQRDRWRPSATFSTWLFTIVANLCRNRLRDRARRPVAVPVAVDEAGGASLGLLSPVSDDPQARAEATELAGRTRRALLELPDSQRAALLLRRFEGLSYVEIAVVLGVSPSAVDSLLVRARRTLARLLLPGAQETAIRGVQLGRGAGNDL